MFETSPAEDLSRLVSYTLRKAPVAGLITRK